MYNKYSKFINKICIRSVTALTAATIVFNAPTAFASDNLRISDFNDMDKPNAWYYQTMDWGIQSGIITGYNEGGVHKLKPEQVVNEAEFLTMLIRFFPNSKDEFSKLEQKNAASHWADHSYDTAKLFNIPITGAADNKLLEQPVNRGQVAMMIAGAFGKNYDVGGAITFLFDSGLSEGRSSKTIEGYEQNGILTRAEAVAFLKNIKSKVPNALMQTCPTIREVNPNVNSYTKPAPTPTPAPSQPVQGDAERIPIAKLDGVKTSSNITITNDKAITVQHGEDLGISFIIDEVSTNKDEPSEIVFDLDKKYIRLELVITVLDADTEMTVVARDNKWVHFGEHFEKGMSRIGYRADIVDDLRLQFYSEAEPGKEGKPDKILVSGTVKPI
ncbi:S-layer homology domain-containing protein [Paenibacillus sedimenti]|uniref:S-layer homology domain-containing protein n=1 Tax=Paenibacillus sedimenti TaxID=2770274 RepID=A0A926KZ09_9BACL|nr:S-layer homology domain-containing protein [Paenibacillus sedimenti]MBD0384848.1 S-layer homology domain-containing protein [Paenibacillus sedimenti]